MADKAFEAQINIPFQFTPSFDGPKTGEGQYGTWYLWGGKINGQEGSVFGADWKLTKGQTYTITKREKGQWDVSSEATQAPQTAPTSQPAPTPPVTTKKALQDDTALWIRLQAIYKSTSPDKDYIERCKETLMAEKLLRMGVKEIMDGGEVTTDSIQSMVTRLEVPF